MNDLEMKDNNRNILNIDIFTRLIKVAQDFSNFKNHKTLFILCFYFFIQQKKRYIQY